MKVKHCPACLGRGEVRKYPPQTQGWERGEYYMDKCQDCNGTGRIKVKRTKPRP